MFASTSPRVQAGKIPLQLLIRLLTPALSHHTGARVRSCHGVNKLHHHTHSSQGTNSTQACLLGCSPLPPSPSRSFLPALATKSSAVKLEKFRRSPSVQLPQLPDKDRSLQRSISRIYRKTASTTSAPERDRNRTHNKSTVIPAPLLLIHQNLPNLTPSLRNQT